MRASSQRSQRQASCPRCRPSGSTLRDVKWHGKLHLSHSQDCSFGCGLATNSIGEVAAKKRCLCPVRAVFLKEWKSVFSNGNQANPHDEPQ